VLKDLKYSKVQGKWCVISVQSCSVRDMFSILSKFVFELPPLALKTNSYKPQTLHLLSSSLTARSLYKLPLATIYIPASASYSPPVSRSCAPSLTVGSMAALRFTIYLGIHRFENPNPDRLSSWLFFAPTTPQCNPSEAPPCSLRMWADFTR